MISRIINGLLAGLLVFSLAACVAMPEKQSQNENVAKPAKVHNDRVNAVTRTMATMPLSKRLSWPKEQSLIPENANEQLYSFVAKNLPIKNALQIFARAYGLNIIADRDVQGQLNVEFRDLPFDQAMEAMLDVDGYYWKRAGKLISVHSWETRNFTINYIRLVRSGSSHSTALVSSGGSDGGDSGSDESGRDAGEISIEQQDTVEFWKELEEQLQAMISKEGRILINRMAGSVQVSDRHPRVDEVARYIAQINDAVHRQVDINVKIVEVALNDDFSLGVDWTRLTQEGSDGTNTNLTFSDIITQPAGGVVAKLPSTVLNIFGSRGDVNFSAVINALQEQGEVRTVSQPKIRTLNNQSAMIKVGTDRTFFRRELLTDTTSAGSTTQSQDVPQVVTEGIVLAITPQISTEGWIMMDVSPVVTRVASVSHISDANGVIQSSAPNLDIRQASSLVRAQSGETIVIGGLIQDQETETERSVPLLGSIPVIGKLFQGSYKSKVKKELVMFITASLVDPPISPVSTY